VSTSKLPPILFDWSFSLDLLVVVETHLLNQVIGLILYLVHQGGTRCHIYGRPHGLSHFIVEGLHYLPFGVHGDGTNATILESFLIFIEHLIPPLRKVVIELLVLTVLLGGNNLARKALMSSFHIVINPTAMNKATSTPYPQ